ncbi:hypothetical protein [Yoonia tamlensis]|uniref:hypothetical protein n=1 Tax=Yoonia tamlensis TaxID=390270 RepID=UPI0010424809|nr:hypothetical protein [Yoonia tamlensis]
MEQKLDYQICGRLASCGLTLRHWIIDRQWLRVQTHNQVRVDWKAARDTALNYLCMKRRRNCVTQRPLVDTIGTYTNLIGKGSAKRPQINQVFYRLNFHSQDISGRFFQLSALEFVSIDIFSSMDMCDV